MKVPTHLITAMDLNSLSARLKEGDHFSALREATAVLNRVLNPVKGRGLFGAERMAMPMGAEEQQTYDEAVKRLQDYADANPPQRRMRTPEPTASETPTKLDTTKKAGDKKADEKKPEIRADEKKPEIRADEKKAGVVLPNAFTPDDDPGKVETTVTGIRMPEGANTQTVAISPGDITAIINLILAFVTAWRNRNK